MNDETDEMGKNRYVPGECYVIICCVEWAVFFLITRDQALSFFFLSQVLIFTKVRVAYNLILLYDVFLVTLFK